VPDLAIEARGPRGETRILILDAKYRLDQDRRSAPQDALAEAYAYHASIGAAGRPCVDCAYILYPGLGDRERYPGGAGAIPLLPGHTGQLEVAIMEWVESLAA
jgi:large subunit ribosomal protein MRP49